MMETYRFIHASRLLLDHQLHATGEFEAAVRKTIEQAALVAFERVIDEALDREVDFLLISGDCLDPADETLRGAAALVRGIARLAERDTPVILHAGPRVWSNWPAGLRWPPSARRLGTGFESRVPVTRQGKLLVTISADCVGERHAGWHIHRPDGSGIGRTISLTESPRPLQGIRSDETGPHGCTVTEIRSEHEPEERFVPLAPVRWERYPIAVDTATTRDDLLHDLASQLEQASRYAGEQVRLVSWDVIGQGPLLDQLGDSQFLESLHEDLALLDPVPGVSIHTHAIDAHYPDQNPRPPSEGDDLAVAFNIRLQEQFSHPEAALRQCLAASALHHGPWEVKIESLLGELDAGELGHDARRLAMTWFAAEEELSS